MRTETRRTDGLTDWPRHRLAVFVTVTVAGAAWDLYSKSLVFQDLGYPSGESTWVRQYLGGWITFRLHTSLNEGALWGVGQGLAWLFAALSVVAATGICYWLFVRGAARSLWLTLALALIMAGTIGNLYDRMAWHGCVRPDNGEPWYAVRDFLLFTFGGWPWPVFNFADVFLVIGAALLVLQSFVADSQPLALKEAAQQPASRSV